MPIAVATKTADAESGMTHPYGGIVLGNALTALARISESETNAVIVRRPLRGVLARLTPLPEPGYCRMVPLDQDFRLHGLLGKEFGASARAALARDMRRLCTAYRALFAGPARAELHVTNRDDCRKFHVDYYRARLLVTYAGPGTELAPEDAVDRAELCSGKDEADPASANQRILMDPQRVVRAMEGDIVLLKGQHFESGRAAVHRSPPILASNSVRLVFKLTIS
ncbi:MAG TPA: DUF1826 domain-containing protein [Polyangiaceae bacterium]